MAADNTRLFQLSKAARKAGGSGAIYLRDELRASETATLRSLWGCTNRGLAAMSET